MNPPKAEAMDANMPAMWWRKWTKKLYILVGKSNNQGAKQKTREWKRPIHQHLKTSILFCVVLHKG